ncbi:MAG: cation transporter [Chloroflexota bacterium]
MNQRNLRLFRKGLYLEYFTVGYNVLEAAVSVVFGIIAGSIALVGFGLDSVVESLSGLVLIWRLAPHRQLSPEAEERRERRAMRLVAVTFLVLGAYILYGSASKLLLGEAPRPSLPGIIIAAVSLVLMPLLTWQKYRTGQQLGSRALMADAKETLACALLSLALLLGLGANYLFGFWQADPIVGLLIVAFLFREGWEGWRELAKEDEADD